MLAKLNEESVVFDAHNQNGRAAEAATEKISLANQASRLKPLEASGGGVLQMNPQAAGVDYLQEISLRNCR